MKGKINLRQKKNSKFTATLNFGSKTNPTKIKTGEYNHKKDCKRRIIECANKLEIEII